MNEVVLVVDVANVVGSKPDGWWRDRAGASTRVLDAVATLVGRPVERESGSVTVLGVVAVLEGKARSAVVPAAVDGVLAPGSGDDAVVEVVEGLSAQPRQVLVVTADRGLRARLPDSVDVAGPGWLRGLIGL